MRACLESELENVQQEFCHALQNLLRQFRNGAVRSETAGMSVHCRARSPSGKLKGLCAQIVKDGFEAAPRILGHASGGQHRVCESYIIYLSEATHALKVDYLSMTNQIKRDLALLRDWLAKTCSSVCNFRKNDQQIIHSDSRSLSTDQDSTIDNVYTFFESSGKALQSMRRTVFYKWLCFAVTQRAIALLQDLKGTRCVIGLMDSMLKIIHRSDVDRGQSAEE
jgi:hypothetical protein